jgi:hypothetical protein
MLMGAFALGYVLGARAGRERYEMIMGTVDHVRTNPKVRATAQQAVDTAKQQAPMVADKVTSVASTAASAATSAAAKVTGSDSDHERAEARGVHHMAGPQGDLP